MHFFKPQNAEQEISNYEICPSLFEIPCSTFDIQINSPSQYLIKMVNLSLFYCAHLNQTGCRLRLAPE